MDNRLKRFLSLALAVIMVIGMMPANVVFATENVEGQDPAQVEPTTEAPTTEEPAELEETTVHICAYDTVVIDKEATAREAGQKTLSCSCGASKTEKICALECQWDPNHEGECEFVCSKNVRCTLNDGHEGLCEAFGGVVLIDSAMALKAAIDAVEGTGTVTLTGNVSLTETVVIPVGKSIELELNGYVISSSVRALENLGTLTVTDSSTDKTGKIDVAGNGAALLNKGVAIINSGRFVSNQGYALDNEANAEMTIVSTAHTTGIQNKGEMTITSGHFHNNRAGANVIRNISGDLEINGGTFQNDKSDAATIYVSGQPELVVNGGTFLIKQGSPNTASLIDIQNGASFRINGGTFNGGFKVGQGASLIMTGGVFHDVANSDYEIAEGGIVTISGGDYIDNNARAFATQHLVPSVVILVNGQEKVKHEGTLADVVAKIGVKGYATLASAVDAAKTGETIILVANTTVPSPISIDKSLEINLNGKTVTSTIVPSEELGGCLFRVEGDCASFNLTANGGKIVSSDMQAYGIIEVFTAADITVSGGTYDFDTDGGAIFKVRAVNSNTYPSLTLTDVEVETNHHVFDNKDAFLQNLTVTGGEFNTTGSDAFDVSVAETVSFADATISASAVGVKVKGIGNTDATATFAGNVINNAACAIDISSKVDAEIQSGTYNGTTGVTAADSELLITGGKFTGNINAVGAVRVTGGEFLNFVVNQGADADLTITGGKFDNDPTIYLEPEYEWKTTQYVGLKDVRVLDTDTAPVEGADRTKIESILSEIKYSYALRDYPATDATSNLFELVIKLQSIVVDEENLIPTEIVYDVSPKSGAANKKIFFSLPVPSAVAATHVKVYHHDVLMGVYEIQGTGTARYVRLETESFSPFTVVPVTNGATAVAYIGSDGYNSLDAALKAVKGKLTEVLVEINGNVEFSAEAANFDKVTFTGVKREMVITMPGAAFSCDAELVFNNLTVSRLQGGTAGWRDYHFIAKKGLAYNNCTMVGSFNVSGQDTSFNGCQFNNANTSVSGSYALWLFNSFGYVVDVNGCTFDVLNRAVKMYATNRGGVMTLNIDGTTFEAVADANNKTVVEMTFENCGGDAIMLLNIDDSNKNDFGKPEHNPKPGENNAWFNVEGKGTNEITGAVVTVGNSIVYNDCEAKIGNQYYTTLQKAIDAVKNGETIHLIKDTNANVTVKQEAGKSFTIDGSLSGFESNSVKKNGQAIFGGTIYLAGNSRNNGAETLTIQNVKFSTDKEAHDFISCDKTDSENRYAHNVTVKGCSFAATEESTAVVGMRYRQCYNMTVENCEAENLFLLMWATGGDELTVKNTTATGCKEGGVNVGTTANAMFENCTFAGKDYGIRADGSAATTLTVKGSKLTADIPVYIRNVTAENYTLVMEGTNTLTPGNGKTGIVLNKAATITGEYDAGEQPTVRAIVELNGTGLTANDITGEVQTSGKLNFTKATEAAIGKVYFDKLAEAIDAAQTDDTIDLLRDIEANATVTINKAITINGKLAENAEPYTIKAKSGINWKTNSLVKTSAAVTLKNLVVDGNSAGCRGIQLTSRAVTLENVTVKNITADVDGCDYAIMADVPTLTIKGNLKFDGCKYGRLVLGDSNTATVATVSNATLRNVKVNMENAGSKLAVAKNDNLDVQTHVKGYKVVYKDGKYELEIKNTLKLDTGFVMKSADRSRVYIELEEVAVGESITVKLYSGNTLIATTTNKAGGEVNVPIIEDALGVNIVLAGDASSSWDTVIEQGHPRADMPATRYELFINGSETKYGEDLVTLDGIEETPVAWETLYGMNLVVNETSKKTYLNVSAAEAEANNGETLKLLANVTENSAVAIDKKITLDLNGKTISRSGASEGNALLNVLGEVTITNGTVKITGRGSAVWANSTSKLTLTNVNVEGATSGVQMYKTAEVTVNSGKITGEDAVRIYGGVLNVKGGEIAGTANAIITSVNSDAANVGVAKVDIAGGKISGKIVLEDKDSSHNIPEVYRADVIIKGGEFLNSDLDKNDISKVYFGIAASGGTFDKEVPITMCANGYYCEKIENSNPVRYRVIENPGCRIDLSAVDSDNKVVIGENAYVDGKAYEVQPGKVIVLDKEMAKTPYMFITTYGYETKGTQDTKDDYPNAMYVWLAEGRDKQGDVYTSYAVKRFEKLDNFFMYNGTSIRIGGSDTGIRFISSVDVDDVRSLMDGELIKEGILDGATLTEMGTEFWKTNRARSQVYGGTLGNKFNIYKTVDGRNRFTGMLVNLNASEEVVAEPFFSRPYAVMTFMDANEEKTITLYGGTLERSIYYVAQQVDEAGSFKGTSYDSYVKNLIKMGEEYNKKQSENTNTPNS